MGLKGKLLRRCCWTGICHSTLLLIFTLSSGRPSLSADSTFQNPILPGFYPDPSICRVGDEYYLVHSTFEYFPGVPIFHSTDLVHWRQIGYCLTRKSQLPLDKMRASGGIFAPTLRYHDGTFYLITTNVWGGGNFFVTAQNPEGPWSDPIWIEPYGIDPSLLFDDDGTVYYCRHVGDSDGYIGQTTIDPQTGKLSGELKNIWNGTGGVWAEGPHLYKIADRYYLMISEGGTSYQHSVTIARSESPWGPFEACPNNPVLTHRDQPELPLQAVGHADLVETPAGWWGVCLAIRPHGGPFHHLGRETCLFPVRWNDAGWPELGTDGTVQLEFPAPDLPSENELLSTNIDNFESGDLALCWNYLRNPHEEDYSLTANKGMLRLIGSALTLNDVDSPTFVGRRQTALECAVKSSVNFEPQADNEEAGLALRGNDKHHVELGITHRAGRRVAFLRQTSDGETKGLESVTEVPTGATTLSIIASPLGYEFFFSTGSDNLVSLGTIPTKDLSTERIGGFTGVYIGMYATGNGKRSNTPADFDWFEYHVEQR